MSEEHAATGGAAEPQPAAAVYWADVAAVDNGGRLAVLVDAVGLAVGFLPDSWIWWEARYRVLVGRHDTGERIGVREARTRRAARRQLTQVKSIIASSSVPDVRRALDLDF